jgi:predicted NBD/HSP70 family sugar kinase
MRRTGDQALVKEINTSIVLDLIIREKSISRATISAISGLNKGTVSSLVQELIDQHLVYETGIGESSGGRKPVMLQFLQNTGYAVGVDLGVNYIHTILTDLGGNIHCEVTLPHHHASEHEIIALMEQCISTVIAGAPESQYGIVGVGIGIPGIVDSSGLILFAPNLGWRNVNLQSLIQSSFHIPVHVDNEANAGAIGEQQYGAGRYTKDLVYISAGIGIGAGIIWNGEIYRGASGYSGEIGHLTIDADGKPCRCGNHGCWELYASEHALLDQLTASLPDSNQPLMLEDIISLANNKDTTAIAALNKVGRYLGIGIAGITNIFNPKDIIIGNRLVHVEAWLKDTMQLEIETRSLKFHQRSVHVHFSELGTKSTSLGAAYMAISAFIRDSVSITRNHNG